MESQPKPASGPVSLVKANAEARKAVLSLAAKRDACINEMIKAYAEAYGFEKAPHIRRFLRDLIDGKPIVGQKPKPIRMLPGGLRNGTSPTA